MDFSAGVAAVTGGGSGIGEALCLALAGAGMQVAVIDVSADRAAAVAQRIGPRGRPYPLDVTDSRALGAGAACIERQMGSSMKWPVRGRKAGWMCRKVPLGPMGGGVPCCLAC